MITEIEPRWKIVLRIEVTLRISYIFFSQNCVHFSCTFRIFPQNDPTLSTNNLHKQSKSNVENSPDQRGDYSVKLKSNYQRTLTQPVDIFQSTNEQETAAKFVATKRRKLCVSRNGIDTGWNAGKGITRSVRAKRCWRDDPAESERKRGIVWWKRSGLRGQFVEPTVGRMPNQRWWASISATRLGGMARSFRLAITMIPRDKGEREREREIADTGIDIYL